MRVHSSIPALAMAVSRKKRGPTDVSSSLLSGLALIMTMICSGAMALR